MSHKDPKISLFFKKLKVRLFVKSNTKTKNKKTKNKKQKIKSFSSLSKRTLIRTKSVKNKETEGNGPSVVIYHG